jgi:hypothetical protein
MLVMTLAFWAYAIGVVMARTQALIIEREAGASWLRPSAAVS